LTTFLSGITGATGINDSGLADTEFLDEDEVYMGHSFMAGSSNDDTFEPNNWVYDTGTCRNLVSTKDFFINYTPFPSPKIFSSANGTIVRAMGVAPSPNSLRTNQLIESVLYRRRDYESSVSKKYQGHWLFYTRILNANKDWLPLLFPRMEYTQ